MNEQEEYILLKWGSLKGWGNLSNNEKVVAIFEQLIKEGLSASAMTQRRTLEHKRLLCDLIDAVNVDIQNDWTGEHMTKDEAKKYVMEYGT